MINNDTKLLIPIDVLSIHYSAGGAGGGNLQTFITPGTNTNGIIIYIVSMSQAANIGRLMYKTSAPSAWNDSTAIGIMTNSPEHISTMNFPLIIPPGNGLYHQGNGGNMHNVNILYKLL